MSKFASWLENCEKDFKSFTDEEKNQAIETILKLSGPVQLTFLAKKLHVLVKRDFIKLLPTELVHHVLKFLDYGTIARCYLVSKDWFKIVSRFEKVWNDACEEKGFITNKVDGNFKLVLKQGLRRLQRFRYYRTFGFAKQELTGHTSRVEALCYRDGLLASGSGDRTVRLWDVASGECKYTLTCHTCSDLKFDAIQVITASFDNTLGRWEWSTGNCLTTYRGHMGAVFCLDYNTELDIVVSGSSDQTVKIWQMSTGSCLVTKFDHEEWLISVLIAGLVPEYQRKLEREHLAISMSRNCIKLWSLRSSEEYCSIASISTSNEDLLVSEFKPKLLCNGRDVIFSSKQGVCFWNLETFQINRLFKKNDYRLLASGEVFTLCWRVNFLHILYNRTEECLCEIPMRLAWSDGDCCGEVAWLNNCSPLLENGPFYFAAHETKIQVIQWSMNSDVVNGVKLTADQWQKIAMGHKYRAEPE